LRLLKYPPVFKLLTPIYNFLAFYLVLPTAELFLGSAGEIGVPLIGVLL